MSSAWDEILLKHPSAKDDLEKIKEKLSTPPICKRTLNAIPPNPDYTSYLILLLSVLVIIVVLLAINLGLNIQRKT